MSHKRNVENLKIRYSYRNTKLEKKEKKSIILQNEKKCWTLRYIQFNNTLLIVVLVCNYW